MKISWLRVYGGRRGGRTEVQSPPELGDLGGFQDSGRSLVFDTRRRVLDTRLSVKFYL
jgi:hypothetical protein